MKLQWNDTDSHTQDLRETQTLTIDKGDRLTIVGPDGITLIVSRNSGSYATKVDYLRVNASSYLGREISHYRPMHSDEDGIVMHLVSVPEGEQK